MRTDSYILNMRPSHPETAHVDVHARHTSHGGPEDEDTDWGRGGDQLSPHPAQAYDPPRHQEPQHSPRQRR